MDHMDDARRFYQDRLRELHNHYVEQAKPVLAQLARIESLRPPPSIVVQLADLDPVLREQFRLQLGIHAGAVLARQEEDANARILRLERENTRLVQLLRLVDGNPADQPLPAYLLQQIKAARRDVE